MTRAIGGKELRILRSRADTTYAVSTTTPRGLASVLPHREPLCPQPGSELRLHAGGDSMRQTREPFHEIEPESSTMRADEPSGLGSRTVALEARFRCETGHADIQAPAGRSA